MKGSLGKLGNTATQTFANRTLAERISPSVKLGVSDAEAMEKLTGYALSFITSTTLPKPSHISHEGGFADQLVYNSHQAHKKFKTELNALDECGHLELPLFRSNFIKAVQEQLETQSNGGHKPGNNNTHAVNRFLNYYQQNASQEKKVGFHN